MGIAPEIPPNAPFFLEERPVEGRLITRPFQVIEDALQGALFVAIEAWKLVR
jgi:hypothetical protein